jgi:hypothetical protein
VKASKLIFSSLSRKNDHAKIQRLLFSATTGVVFILKDAWSSLSSDTGGLHAMHGMVAEISN